MIYLDYSATTPVDERVLESFNKVCINYPGNVNSLHKLGIEAKELEEYTTGRIKSLLDLNNKDIIYTSGATEAKNQALKGVCFKYKNRGMHIITTMLEHSSIMETCNYLSNLGFIVDYVNIKDDGEVDIDDLKRLLTNDTILVSICAVDSEIGIRQPVEEIGLLLKNYPNVIFHSDATGAIGRVNVDLENID